MPNRLLWPITSDPWAPEEFFPGGPIVDFSRGSQNDFSRGAKNGDISFFPLETKKTTFLLKIL